VILLLSPKLLVRFPWYFSCSFYHVTLWLLRYDSGWRRETFMAEPEVTVIPVFEESVEVQKRVVDSGGVRITKRVHEREEIIDELLRQERVSVERVPVNQPVQEAPSVRREGNTIVIPILEEVVVVEKRLMLKEELRVTLQQTSQRRPQSVILRREEAVIERLNATERKES
jgi:uncharacterized protein (TIGR02271 family)